MRYGTVKVRRASLPTAGLSSQRIGDTAEVFMNGTGLGQTISRSCRLENPVPSAGGKCGMVTSAF